MALLIYILLCGLVVGMVNPDLVVWTSCLYDQSRFCGLVVGMVNLNLVVRSSGWYC